jgi:RHS repeat-associated protein
MITDSTTTVLSLDGFGNVLSQETKVVGVDLVSQVTRTFKNDAGAWLIGLLKTARECSTSAGETACRISELSHDTYGQVKLSTQRSDPDSYETWLRTSFDRDAFGNITHLASRAGSPLAWSPNQGELRESCTSYEPEGIFPFAHKNAAGHLGFARFEPTTGAMLSAVDPNGLVTRWAHDGFGRVAFEQHPDGTTTERTITRATVGGAHRLRVETTSLGGQDETVEYDGHGRAIRTLWYGSQVSTPHCIVLGACLPASSLRLMQRVVFDELGEVARRSLPASEGTPESKLHDDRYTHDAMGRLIAHTTPWGATTTFEHAGTKTTVHHPAGAPSVVQHDALGRTTSVVDPLKGTTGYAYGPFSLLRTVTTPDSTAIITHYDGWGRVSQTDDPDRGTTTMHRNGFGDVTSTTDALSRTVTFFHDALGRTLERDDQENGVTTKTTWSWDVAPLGTGGAKAIGMLAGVVSPDGGKLYRYDDKGRLQTSTLVVGGEMFRARFDYEAQYGRLATITYPSPSLDAQPFVVGHDYDAYGHLVAVRDAKAPASAAPYWKLSEVDDAGRVHKETFGNGVVTTRGYFDDKQRVQSIRSTLGAGAGATSVQNLSYEYDDKLNLTRRHDDLQAAQKDERFLYDDLDRLKCSYFSAQAQGSPSCAASYDYDAAGNLKHKSDVGPDAFEYGDPITKARPHAVTKAGGQSYGYDAAGNQTTRPGGVTVTYTTFDLPRTITRPQGNVDIAYDGDQQRIQKSVSNGDVTLYFGALYQRVTHADGSQEHRYHVLAGGRAVAIVTRGGATPGTRYVHADNLGSVDVLTDEAGSVAERKSFDAFGARRDPQWGKTGAPPASQTTMGFTGHEEEEELGLVNMRGRIYDPKLGRFMTPDPIVSVPVAGQSWNPYSYVLNNPLAYTDPSGFEGYTVTANPSPKVAYDVVFNDDPLTATSGLPKAESGSGAGLQVQEQKPGDQKEKAEDVSQSQAALAGRVSNDTNTTSSSSGQDTAQPSMARDLVDAAKAFTWELVGPSVKRFMKNPIDPTAGLGLVEKAALTGIGLAKANMPALNALRRGDLEGAAAQSQLPVTTPLLRLIQAADDGLDSWNAGCPSPKKIGSTWGKMTSAGTDFVVDVASIAALGDIGLGEVEPMANGYSVAFETKLNPSSFPGVSRGRHFQEANAALLRAMETDAELAKLLADAGVSIEKTSTGGVPRTPPSGWVWHHDVAPGTMQLVPKAQHSPSSSSWWVLHPDGQGGFYLWGK